MGSRVVQNAFFRGYSRFYIHFWPENAQKTTLKFLTVFGPRHLPRLLGRSKMVFQGVIFDSVSITGENRPKNDFEIFWMKQQNLFWPLYGEKGWSKMRFSGVILASILISGQKMPKKPLKFLRFCGPGPPHSSEIVQNDFPRGNFSSCIHSW